MNSVKLPTSLEDLRGNSKKLKKQIELELAYRNLRDFIPYNWEAIEGKRPYVSGWHIDCLCDHLEAVLSGQLSRLIINMPPRSMKSTSISVMFNAFAWLRMPHLQFLTASYAHSLSVRDNVKCRRVLQSDAYLDLMEYAGIRDPETFGTNPEKYFQLLGDQNAKERFENNHTGYRLATSVEGAGTGEGGDIIIIDDPNNVRETESEAIREAANTWFDETMQTRLNESEISAFIIVQQRTHERDLTGHILDKYGDRYTHLILPARYEGTTMVTPLDWEDPRTEIDEPLWPERFPDKKLKEIEKGLGSAAAGQLQQRPTKKGGDLFKVHNFEIVNVIPTRVTKVVRYWDKAGTDRKRLKRAKRSPRTAGVKMGRLSNGKFIVLDVRAGQWAVDEREGIIRQTAELDGADVQIGIEQEPGSGGKESADATILNLVGFNVKVDKPTDSKEIRAEPYATQVNQQNILILKADWNEEFISEHEKFPNGARKDTVDSGSGAFSLLYSGKEGGVW